MNPSFLSLLFFLAAATALMPAFSRRLDLSMLPGQNRTATCPPSRPQSCECGRFREKDNGKYFQCATDPFCEHCANSWSH